MSEPLSTEELDHFKRDRVGWGMTAGPDGTPLWDFNEVINRLLATIDSSRANAYDEGYQAGHNAENARLREQADALAGALEEYEKWEAKLVLAGEAWRGPFPTFTASLYASWMDIQVIRNAALRTYREAVRHDEAKG